MGMDVTQLLIPCYQASTLSAPYRFNLCVVVYFNIYSDMIIYQIRKKINRIFFLWVGKKLNWILFLSTSWFYSGMTWETLILGSNCQLDPSTHNFANWILKLNETQYFKPLWPLTNPMWQNNSRGGTNVWSHALKERKQKNLRLKPIKRKEKINKKTNLLFPIFFSFLPNITVVLPPPSPRFSFLLPFPIFILFNMFAKSISEILFQKLVFVR